MKREKKYKDEIKLSIARLRRCLDAIESEVAKDDAVVWGVNVSELAKESAALVYEIGKLNGGIVESHD